MIVVVSLLMIGGFVAFLYTMGKSGEKLEEEQKARINSELGIVSLQGEQLFKRFNTQTEYVDLVVSGENANVLNPAAKTPAEVYNPDTSKNVANQLARMEDKKEYDFENPLLAINPYGTNGNSLYMYFETKSDCYLKYTITVNDENIPDFSRTMCDSDGSGYCRHEYMITGFIPGMDNYLSLELVSGGGDYVDSRIYRISVPASAYGNPVAIPAEMTKKVDNMSNGLFFCCGTGRNNIALYDNSGYLRGEIPLVEDTGIPACINEADMLIPYASNGIARLTRAGQVIGVYNTGSYVIGGKMIYNGMGQILTIASDSERKTKNDLILSIDMESGSVKVEADMQKILKKVYKKVNKGKKKPVKNWINMDSLEFINNNDLIVSTGKLSSIICLSNIMSANPTLGYIMGSKSDWNYKDYSDKLLIKQSGDGQDSIEGAEGEDGNSGNAEETAAPESEVESILEPAKEEPEPFEDFRSNVGLEYEAIAGNPDDEDSDKGSRYYVSLIDNAGSTSRLRRFLVNEEERTYRLVSDRELSENSKGDTLQLNDSNSIIYNKAAASFCEYGKEGLPLITYSLPLTSVNKNSMKGFWFR